MFRPFDTFLLQTPKKELDTLTAMIILCSVVLSSSGNFTRICILHLLQQPWVCQCINNMSNIPFWLRYQLSLDILCTRGMWCDDECRLLFWISRMLGFHLSQSYLPFTSHRRSIFRTKTSESLSFLLALTLFSHLLRNICTPCFTLDSHALCWHISKSLSSLKFLSFWPNQTFIFIENIRCIVTKKTKNKTITWMCGKKNTTRQGFAHY